MKTTMNIDPPMTAEQAFERLKQYIGHPLKNINNEPYKLEAVLELRDDQVIYMLEGLNIRSRSEVFATLKETTTNYFKARIGVFE